MFDFGGLLSGGLSIAGGLLGSDSQDSARARNLALLRQIEQQYQRTGLRQQQRMNSAMAALQTRLTQGLAGYDQAAAQLATVGDAQANRIVQGGQQAGAQVQQNLQRRGLANTSVADNARLGVQAQVADQQTDLASRIAALQSNLLQQRAGFEADLMGSIANFQMNRSGMETGLDLHRIGTLHNTTFTGGGGMGTALSGLADSTFVDSIGGLLGGIFG